MVNFDKFKSQRDVFAAGNKPKLFNNLDGNEDEVIVEEPAVAEDTYRAGGTAFKNKDYRN